MKSNGKNSFICVILISSIICFFPFLSGCSTKKSSADKTAESESLIPVETAKASLKDINVTKNYGGNLKPVQEIPVLPKIPSKVKKIHVKVGDKVSKDSLLIELDPSDVTPQIKQGEVAYNSAKATVDSTLKKIATLKEQKKTLTSQISTLKNALSKIEGNKGGIDKELLSLENKVENGTLSPVDFETIKKSLNENSIKLASEYANLKAKEKALSEGLIKIEGALASMPTDETVLNAQLNQASVGLENAKTALENFKLKSPINGIVSNINTIEGSMAAAQMPPITIIDHSSLLLDINLSEKDVKKVSKGQSVTITTSSESKDNIIGTIESVSPTIDSRTLSYPCKIKISNNNLKPGTFASAKIVTESKKNTLSVPRDAVIHDENGYFLFTTDGKTVKKILVETGLQDEENIEILSGISEGTEVITKGVEYLKEGDKIKVIRGDK